MKLLNFWKGCFAANKILTIAVTAIATLAVVGGVTFGVYAAVTSGNKENTETQVETETESEKESEVSEEEYYEEELALDDSDENEEMEDEEDTSDWTATDYPYYIKVNRLMNTVTVYSKDSDGNYTVPVRAFACSCGLNDGTPTGIFHTSTKYTWRALYGNVYGQYAYRINGPILFHSVPYLTNGDKGSLEPGEYNKLGTFASMGCVRVAVKDAKWLIENCPSGTTVEIYDDTDPGPLGKPSAVTIDENSPYAGWDPTDPDENNPWRTTPPTITIGSSSEVVQRGTSVDVMTGVSAISISGNACSVTSSGSVDINTVGDYTITYSATDEYGNTATVSKVYQVRDTVKPTLSVNNKTLNLGTGLTGLTVDNLKAQLISSCGISGNDGAYNATLVWDETALQKVVDGINAQNQANDGKSASYSVTVYARDDAGNASDKATITITYTGPNQPTEATTPTETGSEPAEATP